jgi:Predicted membrane protein (DUF2214)
MPQWRFGTQDLSLVHLGNRNMSRPMRLFKEFAARMAPTLFQQLPAWGYTPPLGFSRAIYAAKGWAYYEANGFFWAKIAAFVAVALLSIIPTIQIIRWRRALTADSAFLPAAPDIAGVRRFLWTEVVFFAFIPAFAAARPGAMAPSPTDGALSAVFPCCLAVLQGCTWKKARSLPAGNSASHLKQATLPRCAAPGESIVTILYFAPQLGQLKEIDSVLFMAEIKEKRRIKETNARASGYSCSREQVTQHARDLSSQLADSITCGRCVRPRGD